MDDIELTTRALAKAMQREMEPGRGWDDLSAPERERYSVVAARLAVEHRDAMLGAVFGAREEA